MVPRRGGQVEGSTACSPHTRAGVDELFVDFGQSPATLDELIDLAGRFIEGVQAG
ncbi:hypothetical protein ACIGXK_30535 [Streptomyces venezuelae]|uniref:hypothetical protein n=1 Tax=Streptomyces venezuelae TaxID=54571 RepID=UPI0037D06747